LIKFEDFKNDSISFVYNNSKHNHRFNLDQNNL
jgi:hypothetical protein